ncbi:DUF6461 domain-containing protein [Streptomyces tagetis]|uniref:Uncharacterized protein n=1 Tax=Streptomyces tagetis TaxID=2820809 RepID=A0A940XD84_9ACTN|nr:DUF6461 domain-containing protein [Streptomyces sp. RG38]MBQ0825277.1 hypothetical protein [Streptomyces sp. RG38]
MEESSPTQWAWAADPGMGMWCASLTRGITPHDVLARYGADSRTARLLTRQQAAQLSGTEGSVLRAGTLDAWAFCFEEYGLMGAMPGPLSALSQGTETFSVLRGGDGMNSFAYWRDGQCIERFEPGFAGTRPPAPHPWWDMVQQQLDAAGTEYPGLVPVLKAVALHTDAVLDTDTLNGPLLTLLLDDNSRTPDPPPQPHPTPVQPPGRFLGTVVPDPLSPPAVIYAIRPADQHTQGFKPEE